MPQFSLDTNTTNQCVQSSFPSYEWCIFAKLVQGIIIGNDEKIEPLIKDHLYVVILKKNP